MVFGIVQQAGGRIEVQSAPGEGTTFRLLFPVAGPATETPAPPDAPPEVVPDGTTVLVVEDDPGVRRSVTRMLEGAGFRVLQAADGPEALQRAGAERLDLVLADVVMPGMLGTELAERLRSVQPGTAVAFQSGYADKTERLSPGARFLLKPFTAEALRAFLLETLRRARG
jgi:CheY-like chemotaxis protein